MSEIRVSKHLTPELITDYVVIEDPCINVNSATGALTLHLRTPEDDANMLVSIRGSDLGPLLDAVMEGHLTYKKFEENYLEGID